MHPKLEALAEGTGIQPSPFSGHPRSSLGRAREAHRLAYG